MRRIGGSGAVRSVIPLLRCEEAPARNLAMDILREIGNQDFAALVELLRDDDPDVRIFSSDILGSTDNAMAVSTLCARPCSRTPRSTSAIRPPCPWATWAAPRPPSA